MLDQSRVRIFDRMHVTELDRTNDHWLLVTQTENERFEMQAQAVIIASGGDVACWTPNIVDQGLTGDGYRLLRDLGASLVNMDHKQRLWDDLEWGRRRFATTLLLDSSLQFRTCKGDEISLPPADSRLGASRRTHEPISNLQDDVAFDLPLLETCRKTGPLQVWCDNELC